MFSAVGDRLKYGVDRYMYMYVVGDDTGEFAVDENDNIEVTSVNHDVRGYWFDIIAAVYLKNDYIYTVTQVQHYSDEVLI